MLGSSDQWSSYNFSVKELCIYNGYKEILWPFLGDLFDVLVGQLITIPRTVPGQTTEGGAPQEETHPLQVPVPKKPRMGQIKSNQIEGGSE
jgi:hypothetical protein